MHRSARVRLLAGAVQTALIVSLVAAPAAIAADPSPPDVTPVVTPDPGTTPAGDPEVVPDPTPDPTPAPPQPTPPPTPEPAQPTPEPARPAPEPADPTSDPATPPADPGSGTAAPREADETASPDPGGAPIADEEYVGTIATTTTLAATPPEVLPGAEVTLTATVTPLTGCGTVTFSYEGISAEVALDGAGTATATVVAVAGTWPATAAFNGCGEFSSSTGTADVIARVPSWTWLDADRASAIQYEQPVTLTATVSGDWVATGEVSFVTVPGATVVATAPIVEGTAVATVATLPTGTYELVAQFPGDPYLQPSTSDPVAISVSADTSVKVTGVGVQYARFYPVRDSYKDTDKVFGRTLEPAIVTIRIYNSSGTRVKYWSLGTRNGSYSVTWSGRRSDGSLLRAGTYKVKQSFKDGRGNTRTITKDVVLSHKKLYWYTRSQTKYADSGTFYYDGAGGAYRSTRYYRGVLLDGGYWEGDAALAKYSFGLPSATRYGTLKVSVYGKSISPYGAGAVMFWNYSSGEVDRVRSIGFSTAWYSTSVAGSGHVSSSDNVRVYVAAIGDNLGLVDYQKVKLTYTYALLR